jgi:hypothetical protein
MPRNNYEKKRLLFHSSHHWARTPLLVRCGIAGDAAMAMLAG